MTRMHSMESDPIHLALARSAVRGKREQTGFPARWMDAAFEFFTKLGAPYWCFHDRDIAPEGANLAESNKNSDVVVEVTKELGGENYVFWGGREGYESLLNTNLKREQDLGAFLQMAVDYAKSIGFTGQFLIEPKPKEPTKPQYDFDVATGVAFLRTYSLEKHFKFNIETNHATLAGHSFQHEIEVAASHGMLGSIDANTGDPLLGSDTDQFNTDVRELTLAMVSILKAGGLGSGGLNFDAKLRRTSIDVEDLFHAYIGGMDAYALDFKIAHRILKDGVLDKNVAARYASFDSGFGT